MRRYETFRGLLLAASLAVASPSDAQTCVQILICPTPSNTATTVTEVIDTIFRRAGEISRGELISDAEYERRVTDSIQGIAVGVGTALASFPIASSAGFAQVKDQVTGVPLLKSVSFGPTFVERSLTNGRGVLNLGVSYQYSAFDTLQGVDLKTTGFPAMSQVGDYLIGGTPDPNIEGKEVGDAFFAKLDMKSSVIVMTGSYGVTDRFDLGWAVPVASLSVRGQFVRQYNAGMDYDLEGVAELYPNRAGTLVLSDHAVNASGIGDIVLRTKYGFGPAERQIGMLMGEFRLPTGDEQNLLGTGETSFKLLGGGTKNFGIGSLNVNGGYTFGGLTEEVNFAAGTDVALLAEKKLTLNFDFISQTLRNAVTEVDTVVALDRVLGGGGGSQLRHVTVSHRFWDRGTTTLNRAAVGAKYQLGGNWLLSGSGLFRLNDNGYQAKFVGFVGIEHTWVRK